METTARAHKQTTCPGNHPRSTPSRCFAQRSSRARGLIRGWIQTAWRMDALPKKSHQRSQSTGCVLVRKAPTTPHSQATAPQVKDRWGLQGRPRWGFKRHPRQGVNVKSTWSGCQAKQVGNLSLFCNTTPTMISHTRPRRVIADDREVFLCGGDPPRGLSDETTSLGAMTTATESQLQPFNTSHLDDFCSANDFEKGIKGVVQQGELQGFWLQAIQQHLPKALDFIVVSFFR